MIYLDNAATTYPKPISVTNSIIKCIKDHGANPGRSGHKMSIDAATEIYNARTTVAEFFNAPGPECVVFTLNCTHATNIVIKGLLKEGDHVVISCLEHHAITRPLYALQDKNISVTRATVYPEDNDATINSFRSSINAKTKLIICMHASNVWGIRLPIERISALAHQYGVSILVEAAQSAGVLPINILENKIDYLCVSGHKSLYGPMGTGILITNKGENLNTIIEGGNGTASISYEQPNMLPEKFESGTPNFPGIVGLKAGINFIKKTGIENISKLEYKLIIYLYENLIRLNNIELYMPKPNKEYFVPLLSFNIKNKNSEEVAALLNKKGIYVRAGLHCAPAAHEFCGTLQRGAVRICPSAFSKTSDIDQLIYNLNIISKL